MTSRRALVLSTLASAAIGLFFFACARGEATPRVDFRQTEEPAVAASAPPQGADVIRMAVAPVLSPLQTFSLYQDLLNYLGQRLNRRVELVQGKTYAEINDLMRSGDVTLAIVCTNPYLQGQADFGMEALAVAEVNGQPYYYSYLVVARGSDAGSLADLRGRTFAFSDPLSNSGRLAPVYQLALMGETPETFFKRSIFTYAHDNSVRAVADGLVDATAVDSLIYDYLSITQPDLVAKTKVIDRWGPYGNNPVVVNPGLDPALKDRLREVLLTMDADPSGKAILDALMLDRFVVPDDRIYDSVREMRAYLRDRGFSQ